jgi:hypothetical protein
MGGSFSFFNVICLAVLINKSHSFILGAIRTTFHRHAPFSFASLLV